MSTLKKINTWWQRPLPLVILTSVVMAFVAPYIFKLLHMAVAWRVGLLFIVLDSIFAWWIGRQIKQHQLPWWTIIVFPILFALMVFLRFTKYDYWMAPIYLVISALAWLKD
ncbi:hypothetical protein [Lacticaseibacillus pantheris]|uniref:Integral membrane protein n=1 Tax=Lacticaseibacillus pantheris DSM 15945 = JCM 12539 = NBRC 106106 TaxID=1423783 RepID=A0A0R1TW14_9LACO|nr:hypothetical protein [Lacticaseibacillus pantheris]KRL85398.1 hypothetical protein FC50_GL001557 [Lacticaseibacillus pantheris DSM 15945 = JCM 12539 = NBRC 106106]WKF84513.1 hypothetical protein QY874_09500 [Lacticaseibacillus pantheris]